MENGQPEVVEELTRRGFTDVAIVGRGGHAVVYRAEQPAFGRTVAVKVITDADLDPVAFERFERERRALGSMSNHPNILTVYDGGVTRSGQAFLVTEYAPRGNLVERVARRGPVPWPEAVATGIKLAGALETAHRRGVVHRDVKPENVLLSDYGEPLLGDFGIARITGGFVTSTTIIRASVAHVPPEVLAGERPRPSTDVYSLASTLLTVIWGRPPFFHEDEAVPAALRPDRPRVATGPPHPGGARCRVPRARAGPGQAPQRPPTIGPRHRRGAPGGAAGHGPGGDPAPPGGGRRRSRRRAARRPRWSRGPGRCGGWSRRRPARPPAAPGSTAVGPGGVPGCCASPSAPA